MRAFCGQSFKVVLLGVLLALTVLAGQESEGISANRAVPVFLTERLALIYSDLVDEKGKVLVEDVFLGSGVFINGSAVLTARHVVEAKDWLGKGKYTPVAIGYIERFDGRTYQTARLKVTKWEVASKTDLALITVESKRSIEAVKVASNPSIGDPLVTLSAPYGEITFSSGIAHSYARIYYSSDATRLLMQASWKHDRADYNVFTLGHNLTVAGGSSGGGVFTAGGELVGIHVASASQGRLAYAITASEVSEFLREMLKKSEFVEF